MFSPAALLALVESRVFTRAGARAGSTLDVGELIHAYGRELVQRDPARALEYYMLAARAARDALPVKGRLLRELLTESKAYGAPPTCG